MTFIAITPAQCRAARGLLRLTQADLAERSALSRKTVADFEQENRDVHARTLRDIKAALETAGVTFIACGVLLEPKAEAA